MIALTCGCAATGDLGSLNDPVPTGTIVAQGTFTGLNGKSASGMAVIYSVASGSYILRLSGVNLPDESGLQLIIVANSTNLSSIMLRGSSGNQNYTFSYSGTSPTFNQVRLYSMTAFTDYATALLTQ